MKIFRKLLNKNSNTVTSIPESWNIIKDENDGNPMLVRKNAALDKIAGNQNYSVRCGIAFKLLFPDENGLADIQKEPELNDLEDSIFEAFETDLNSIVAAVITTSGFREFVLYTKNVIEFNSGLDKLKEKYPHYKLTSYTEDDPDWSTYRSFQ